ncbi:hypothetical protein PR202_gb27519 [Eleusine coracana subsp. coracana]|uniref:Protein DETOXIFICATION n=1 Tax=Eleusine coracana subsp. coracana TaxID=191504 RepID=A0AAV5FW97_ELECO|nr:hypothetical protein PR202_gb27519 [Eleusine coracana subsp. coracana]
MGGSSESEVPLLLPLPLPLAKESNQREDGGWWGEATAEAGRLAALAAPMIAVALLQLMMQLISTIMVGHLGEIPLAGAAIASSLTNVTGLSVLTKQVVYLCDEDETTHFEWNVWQAAAVVRDAPAGRLWLQAYALVLDPRRRDNTLVASEAEQGVIIVVDIDVMR